MLTWMEKHQNLFYHVLMKFRCGKWVNRDFLRH